MLQNPKALIPLDPKHFFYHDVPEQKTQRALDNLGGCPLSHVMNTPTKVAWREIPTAYLICEDDRALTFKASHSPFLSMPGETAKAIHGFLEKA